ncbi:MAG: NapC/NirT family cytochrome c [Acidobacteriota bacterium]|nr:NapC/NirT family cytochrome c [Acidobacteriota bacterium]
MSWLVEAIKAFIRLLSKSRVSQGGAILVTVLFPALLLGCLLDLSGVLGNPYFGFMVYLVMGPLFILGLLAIAVGLLFFRRKDTGPTDTYFFFRKQLESPQSFRRMQWVVMIIGALTVINVVVVALFSYTGFHYTESVAFCGEFCHSVMQPEYSAYSRSPHSRVKCVECHIGEGAKWFAKSKLSGARQFLAVALNTYSRPIETPIRGLRPARDTCEECHRPEFFFGEKLYVKHKFLPDQENTAVKTVLLMKIGSGGGEGHHPHGIHWHVSEEAKIDYRHADWKREQIFEVTMTDEQGQTTVFRSGEDPEITEDGAPWSRTMDCVDCHNRPTHIYLSAEEALDQKLFSGHIPKELPFIKRQGLEALAGDFGSTEEALAGIEKTLREWYSENYAGLVEERPDLLDKAIAGVQEAFAENVFPEMGITWGTYKSHLGHPDFMGGCFRCHDDEHSAEDGRTISGDCDLCHVILAEDEPDPEILGLLQNAE